MSGEARPYGRWTSLEAYRRITEENLLSKMRTLVYSLLFRSGPMTGAEVDEQLRGSQGGRGHYHKRLPELEQQGVATRVGDRECNVTGRRATAWDVTDQLPSKRAKPKRTPRPTKREMGAALAELRALFALGRDAGRPQSAALVKLGRWLVSLVAAEDRAE